MLKITKDGKKVAVLKDDASEPEMEQDVWTQEEIDEAKAKAKELMKIFNPEQESNKKE